MFDICSVILLLQYYYNSTSGQYMYWDAERSTYLPAPEGVGSKDDSQGSQSRKDSKEDKKDKDKVKIAKKIAKVSVLLYR